MNLTVSMRPGRLAEGMLLMWLDAESTEREDGGRDERDLWRSVGFM